MKSSLLRLARRLSRAFGYDLVHHSRDPLLGDLLNCQQLLRLQPGETVRWNHELGKLAGASALRSLLDLHRIDLVLDIGANEGQFALGLRSLGYTGDIISFEPGSTARARLTAARTSDPAWFIRAEALGATDGHAHLHVPQNDVFSSLHTARPDAHTLFPADLANTRAESVPLRTLDTLWPELTGGRLRRVLLKSDTQGHEAAVLMGARTSLPAIRAAVLEGAVRPLYEGDADWRALIDSLSAAGLDLSAIISLSQIPRDLTLLEVDLYFTRQAD